jgi:hypothetical protein
MRKRIIQPPWPAALAALIGASLAGKAVSATESIQTLSLQSERPLAIGIGMRTATTLQFPEPISGLVGYGLTEGQEPGIYQFTHPPGSRFLSLRGLMADREADVTVMLGDDMYVLRLVPSEKPAVAIRLVKGNAEEIRRAIAVDPEEVKERRLDYSAERLVSLLQLGKNERVFRAALPQMYEGVESRRNLDLRFDDGEVATVIREIHRFPTEDAFMIRAEIENRCDVRIGYDPGSLQVRVGPRAYPSTMVDASGEVPAKGSAPIHLIVKGNPEGGRAHLSIENDFRLVPSEYGPYHEPEPEAAALLEPIGGEWLEPISDGLPQWKVASPQGINPALFGETVLGYGKQPMFQLPERSYLGAWGDASQIIANPPAKEVGRVSK